MASSSTNKSTANQDPNQHPLQCPRCSSSNTKFCYYNNYSLSQPRHFCKACKRYWTRGGTLRNVPVGGGCRKNKRHKRHPSPSTSANPSLRNSPPSNPLFYGLPTTPQELSFPFSSFRVSSDSTGFYLNPQIGSGLNNSHSSSIFFGSSTSFSTTSTMASLLASTMHQQKEIRVSDTIPGLMPCEDAQIGKEVRAVGENRLAWDQNQNQNPMDQINYSDPSSLLWNTTSIGAWFDPSTMGSSVPSLI